MIKNPAAWLSLSAVTVASAVTAFVVLPGREPSQPATETASQMPLAIATLPAQTAPENTAEGPATEIVEPAAPAAETAPENAPSFDILRVEKDGSTVIAGRAEPNSRLEVADGDAVVATVEVGPSGDFAAILDQPLAPGAHELRLKAVDADGKAAVSAEVATVSVPKTPDGDLLALVTRPGEASRLIAVPEPVATAPQAAVTETASLATPAAQAPAAAVPEAVRSEAAVTPAPQAQTAVENPAPLAVQTVLRIGAVEIEGDRIFVAGIADANARLAGDVGGKAIGGARASTDGRFVIEGRAELAPGTHRVGVEALGGDGKPLLRVEVDFDRPAGAQVAAIDAAPAAEARAAGIDNGNFERLRLEVVHAFGALRGLYVNDRVPSLEQMVAARSVAAGALRSLAEYRLPEDAAAVSRAVTEGAAREAGLALAALQALPGEVTAVGSGLQQVGDVIARAVGPVIAQRLRETAAAREAAGVPVIEQAPLSPSAHDSVIIRRGDTLWQISRRVYGQGVRYTTIYLANQDRIANPDRIRPGQIFDVPQEARPDAESLHRDRLQQRR